MEYSTYFSPLRSKHLLYDIPRLRLLAILFVSLLLQFGNRKLTGVTFIFNIQYDAL